VKCKELAVADSPPCIDETLAARGEQLVLHALMPKKQKVRAAVRKLKEDVGSCIPTDADGRSAYRAVGENGDEDTDHYYADTPGGRDYNGEQSSASQGYGKAGGSGSSGMCTRNDGDGQDSEAVVMDTSLAAPVQLHFGTRAFERVIADPSLAGVDFVIDEPARARATPTEGAVRRGGYSREQHRTDDDDDMTVHEPAQKWGDTEADREAEAENDGNAPFYDEHGDGIELLKLRAPSSSSSGANGHGGHHCFAGGKITNTRAFIHILKSYIGSGVLGLPYAYAQGGMLAAMAGMLTVSVMSTLCVFLLLDCKHKLTGRVRTFGDVGYGALGRTGHILVELTVVLSQLGFSCAYLIFVSQNLFLYLKVALTSEASIVWALVPVLVALSWIPSLDVLAPFSVLALALIFSGLGAVAWHAAPLIGSGPDVQTYIPSTLPIFIGMAIYAFEGIGLALPIQNQMKHPESFKTVWAWGMIVVTSTYIAFGSFCYSCYGDEVLGPLPPVCVSVCA